MTVNTHWTPERIDQLRALAADGLAARDVAAKIGTTVGATFAAAIRNKISFFRPRVWTPERIDQLREMAEAGLYQHEAATKLDASTSSIQKAASHYKIRFPGRKAHAKPSPKCKPKFARFGRPKGPALGDRSDEIARYIAERGVTRCPPAFAAPSPQGAVS